MSILLKKICLSSIFFSPAIFAMTISGHGSQKIENDVNALTACSIAETKAIKQAINNFTQKEFSASKKNFCFETKENAYCNYYNEIDYSSTGTIKRISNKKEWFKEGTCFVSVDLDIERSRYLKVDVTGKNIYRAGENLKFEIKAKEPLYLYVFNLHRKGVELLFPYGYNTSNLIDDGFEFPSNGMKYVTYLNEGVTKDEEIILLLLTKHYVEFDRHSLNRDMIYEIINSIPIHSKRTFTYNILINRK